MEKVLKNRDWKYLEGSSGGVIQGCLSPLRQSSFALHLARIAELAVRDIPVRPSRDKFSIFGREKEQGIFWDHCDPKICK